MNTAMMEEAAPTLVVREDIRNIAIIAHVDHGKTTLVDKILKTSGAFRANEHTEECMMDSNDLERERGITILAKNCSAMWKGVKINVIDTPGHADFGGEVERVLKMADGCLLLVDSAEGPLPQTRFVLRKAFQHGLQPIVVINKIDRKDARPQEVLNEVFDLFIDLDASEEQLDFPVLYGSGREGFMCKTLDEGMAVVAKQKQGDMRPLMDAMLERVGGPKIDERAHLQFLVSNIDHDDFVGRIAIGRVFQGALQEGQPILLVKHHGGQVVNVVKQLFVFKTMGKERASRVEAGDICAVVGLEDVEIGDSITDPNDPKPLPPVEIEPPTITMDFIANDSPFRGQEGKYVTSRNLRERLQRELKKNVALRVVEDADPTVNHVSGRGLLHLGVLLENMRREGYEVQVSKPEVIMKKSPDGRVLEPMELLVVDVPTEHQGKVIEQVGNRRGEMHKMEQKGDRLRLEFKIPARGLIGLRTRLLNSTRGEAVMHHMFIDYEEYRGDIAKRNVGVQVSMSNGVTTPFALFSLKDRGPSFIKPKDAVYEGQIVGEHCKDNDIVVNTTREKHLTNIRSAGADEKVVFPPPRVFSLEEALEYIDEDELVEITPKSIRLRKKHLRLKDRKRADGKVEVAEE
ncbi:MAG TPA: translational GTPase TypA [Planctomycetota bacterium]|nr:translational GTPase TypA [Planctomycetota bacterium]